MTRDPEALYFLDLSQGAPVHQPRRLCFRRCLVVCLSVCLSVCLLSTLRKNFRTDLHEMSNEGWQWANEQMIDFWWRYGRRLGTWIVFRIRHEKSINRLRCAMLHVSVHALQCRHSNYDVITSPAVNRQPR